MAHVHTYSRARAVARARGLRRSFPASLAAADDRPGELRVVDPTQVLDPGTDYTPTLETVKTDPRPTASATAPAAAATSPRRRADRARPVARPPARRPRPSKPLSVTDQFGFGLGICGIGGERGRPDEFWYLKSNHEAAPVGGDQLTLDERRRGPLVPDADNFPAPNPAELELTAPATRRPAIRSPSGGQDACVDGSAHVRRHLHRAPAAEVTIAGGTVARPPAPTAPRTVERDGPAELAATRGADIPSERAVASASPRRSDRARRARRADRRQPQGDDDQAATKGSDSILARGGNDVDRRPKGGTDRVNCGAGKDVVDCARARGRQDRGQLREGHGA